MNSIQLKETQEERDKTTESVVQDRQYQVLCVCERESDGESCRAVNAALCALVEAVCLGFRV